VGVASQIPNHTHRGKGYFSGGTGENPNGTESHDPPFRHRDGNLQTLVGLNHVMRLNPYVSIQLLKV
jgi:hypothetical protein